MSENFDRKNKSQDRNAENVIDYIRYKREWDQMIDSYGYGVVLNEYPAGFKSFLVKSIWFEGAN